MLLTCGLTEQRAVVVTYVVKFIIPLTNQINQNISIICKFLHNKM